MATDLATALAYEAGLEAGRAEARAEVERLRAVVARQHEALGLWAAIPNPERTHVRCAYCAISVPAAQLLEQLLEHTAGCVLADPDGQRAAEEWAALVKVAEAAEKTSAWLDDEYEPTSDLRDALDRLRAVREKEGEG